jgi:hypothetical protein
MFSSLFSWVGLDDEVPVEHLDDALPMEFLDNDLLVLLGYGVLGAVEVPWPLGCGRSVS